MNDERRIATLVAFAHVNEATAMDDALDVFDLLITEITYSAELNRKKERFIPIKSTMQCFTKETLPWAGFHLLVRFDSDVQLVKLVTTWSGRLIA
jgi:hypothetical protein